jgi:hypothetical protein
MTIEIGDIVGVFGGNWGYGVVTCGQTTGAYLEYCVLVQYWNRHDKKWTESYVHINNLKVVC